MKIKRHFTTKENPHRGIKFKKRNCRIKNFDGSIVFHQDNVEFPEHWSQNACDIFAQKYLRKTRVPKETILIKEKNIPSWLYKSIPRPNSEFTK